MSDKEMVRWTLIEASEKIRSREISPVDLVKAYLEAIERKDSDLNSFITVTGELALEQARAAEREILDGRYRGELHGIPVALKDIIDTAGVRTTSGSKILAHSVPGEDAQVWAQLREAGCVLIGKANLHEFARGSTTDNPHYGRCYNPWDPTKSRIPGGSSGGSGAAAAACLCAGALGTDTMGSVRKPAARCGIVGIKPTYDRVSRQGVTPLSWSLDHVGPMARTVVDAATMLSAMLDPAAPSGGILPKDIIPPQEVSVKGTRVGLVKGWWDAHCDEEVGSVFRRALDALMELGCEVQEVEFPYMDKIFAAGRVVSICEAASFHEHWIRERFEDYGEDVRNSMLAGFLIPARDYIHCLRVRAWGIKKFHELFSRVDVLVSPTTKEPAPKFEETKGVEFAVYTGPAAFIGLPAVSVPCGFSGYGIPIGLQVMAPHYRDDVALRVARAYEAATDWSQQRPPVCG
ncbi:MAG: amidase [Deltaproteobacteria bacterium]|nr:amidase [Deltaproteobacteria bacterium]